MVGVGTLKAAVKEQPRLQELARATARTTGRLTASARMTPSFLIVGAQRCGTTSMYKTLSQHPLVLPAVLHKGAHYFDTGYGHGPAWYHGHFPLRATARLTSARLAIAGSASARLASTRLASTRLASTRLASAPRGASAAGGLPITGESSPYYMFHPLAGQRIAADLPGVKLLVLLRDPVERAYSAHAHETARGFETEPFEQALELEPTRLAGEEAKLIADPAYDSFSHQHHAYVTRGRYADQLRRLEKLFGRDRIHVIDSQRFFTDPEPVFAEVVDFLGLGPASGIVFSKHNARPRSAMPDSVRRRLSDQLADSDADLETWLGAPPSWRVESPGW